MTLVLLFASEALLIAAAALAVKTQLALFRGFDLGVAAAVLLAAESAISVAGLFPEGNGLALTVGAFAGALLAIAWMSGWNLAVTRLLKKHHSPGTFLFVFSLGTSTAMSALVGILRGPGLQQMDYMDIGRQIVGIPLRSPTLGVLVGVPLMALFLFLLQQRSWLSIDLLAQDREFSLEIGVKPKRSAVAGAVMTGLSAAFVGWYMAFSSGSTPELGLQMFLLGAGGALLLPGSNLSNAILGGLMLGATHVLLQLLVAPSLSMAILFVGILILVAWRGTSRKAQGVR